MHTKMKLKTTHLIILFIFIFLAKCEEDLCHYSKCKVEDNKCVDANADADSDSPRTCDPNCKPNLLNKFDMKCYDCRNSDGNKYYSINDPICTGTDICNGYIIEGSNQCVNTCGDSLYKMGDYCYINQPINTLCNMRNECICSYYYHIELDNSKQKYVCYDDYSYGEDLCLYGYKYIYKNGGIYNLCSKVDCLKKRKAKGRNIYNHEFFYCVDECYKIECLDVVTENSKNVEYCRDTDEKIYYEDDYNRNICMDSCNDDYPKKKGNKCVKESECDFIDGDNCYDSCKYSNRNFYHNFNEKNCIYKCDLDSENKFELDRTCYSECPSHFVKSDRNICISESLAKKCFYIEDEIIPQNNKECYDKCPTGHEYYNYNSKKCIPICSASGNIYKYHKEGSFECYPSCIDIPTIGEYIYEDNFVCSNIECSLYISLDNGVKQCYQDEQACRNKGYNFKNGKECVKICKNFKALYKTLGNQVISLGLCFTDKDDCINQNYFYYNSKDKICWNDGCGEGYYTNELDGFLKPKEDNSGNTCTKVCFEPYPKLSSDGKFCKTRCGDDEFFTASDPIKCISNLQNCNGFLKEDNECVSICPNYYYTIGSLKKCTNNCNTVSRFFYENEKECRNDCDIFSDDDTRCLKQCPQNKKVSNKHCVSDCPSTEPNYKEIAINGVKVNKCVLNCDANSKIIAFINKCVERCPEQYQYINGLCYPKCPEGKKYLNPKTLTCEDKCPSDLPVCEKLEGTDICICKLQCDGTNQYILKGECVSTCSEQYNKIGKDNVCKESCLSDQNGEFYIDTRATTSYKIYKCCTCPSVDGNYFKDKECFEACPPPFNYVINNEHKCLSKCPGEYPYYNKNSPEPNGHIICSNNFICNSGTNKYYLDGECVDENRCISKNKAYIDNNNCVSNCKEGFKYKKIDGYNIYECKDGCDPLEYILDNKECLDKCPNGKNFIGKDNNCKRRCEVEDGLHYYLVEEVSDEPSYKIYKCVTECSGTYYLSVKDNNECFKECADTDGYPYLSRSENMCFYNCLYSPINKFTINNECSLNCDDPTKIYYYEEDKICKDECNTGHYAIQNINQCVPDCSSLTDNNYYSYTSTGEDDTYYKVNTCVVKCPENKPFADNDNNCVDECPGTSRYYIKEFMYGETNLQKKCLNDCPQNYPFYTIDTASTPKIYYPCQNECREQFYVPNFFDQNVIAKLCLLTCDGTISPYENYKYKIIDATNNNNKTCYDICPPEKPYHMEAAGSDCLAICPDDAPFHEIGSTICITADSCSGNYIDYETRECLKSDATDCPSSRKYKSKINTKTICLDACIQTYGIYLSPYNTCVEDCSSSDLVRGKHLKNDIANNICICDNLYYIDNSLQIVCLERSIDNCKNAPNFYKIAMHDSNECIQTCLNRGILSPSEDICYEGNYECSQIDINSHLITKENGQKKCDCLNKYYINGDKKICLNETSKCPSGHDDKYVPSIKECLKNGDPCPEKYKFSFDNFCLDICPSGSQETDNICECNDGNKIFWYEVSNANYKCLPQCPDNYPVYIAETKQCLKKCTGTFYPYLFENKCYSSCNSNDNLNIVGGTAIRNPSELSEYICGCPDKWYIDENKKTICVNDCFSGDKIFKYLVRKTLQCVNECPIDYPYYFNKECYSSCENEAKQLYHLSLKTVKPLLECQCENLWYFTDNEKTTKECLVQDKCTLSNTENIYLKEGTKQCIKECPREMFKFNYICYIKCPAKTIDQIDSQNGKFCKCNLNDGYWYEYQENEKTFYACGVSECPKYSINDNNIVPKNLIELQKKCVNSCLNDGGVDNEFKLALRNICVKKCPILCKPNEPTDDECIFYDLNNEDLDEIEKLKNAVNVQSKELYESSLNSGGFLFNKFDTSIQIYAIDKYNTLKGVSLKSNLTYIDFGTCLEKIFSDKRLGNNDKILVSKYDLLPKENTQDNNKKKYLINKVEYELFSSKMNEKIDASVCSPYEIIISYPLVLDRYDNYINGINKNEYKKLFDIGKELYMKNNKVDIFNYNNTAYKDICTGIEINGKDLVLEDRYKYLYPNDVFFCEDNCTMNNTDFELERINCLCNYKHQIEFEREDEDTEIKVYSANQSFANVEVLKCLGKLTVKQSIKNNGAFYYCAVITVVEIFLSFSSFINTIKTVSSSITNILNKIGLKKPATNSIKFKKISKYKNDNLCSTNRVLNNPPKKIVYDDEEDEQNNDDNFTFYDNDIKSNNDDGVIFNEENIAKKEVNPNYDSNNNIKAEFIPPKFNSRFFKLNDKGVIKKIERSKLPFKINPETKYLIEIREGVNYDKDYLNGPFYSDQNILVVEDLHNNKEEEKKIQIKKRNTNNKDLRITSGEKSFIKIKRLNLSKLHKNEKINIEEYIEDNNNNKENNEDKNARLITSIKVEQMNLRKSYNKYTERKHSISIVFLAEILDKIYFVKICSFLKIYESFSIHASLYLFCHLMLLTILCSFFSIAVIRKIWEENNFPDIRFYLLYGLICNLIVWVIYQIFLCILDIEDGVKEILNAKINENNDEESIDEIKKDLENKKLSKLISQMRIKMIIFYLVLFLFTMFCSIYLISFFSIYTGTKSLVLKAYYISIIEIVLIKFVYGIILASLRIASIANEFKLLYKIVYIFDKYIS